MKKAKENLKVQQYITLLAVTLFAIKIIAWYITHSLTVLSDALESIVNIVAGFISLYSLNLASKPKDLEHPYGHGKAEFISAALEGVMIMMAGLFIIYQSIMNFIYPKPLNHLNSGILLISITAIINFFAGQYCIRIGNKNNSPALLASGKHLQTDTWSTLAVIIGLALMAIFSIQWLDVVLAVLLSAFILYNGYGIVRRSLAGIMDEADMNLLYKMVDILNENRRINWIDLHNLRVIKYGNKLHIDCHLTVPWYLNVHDAHKEVEALNNLIKIHFEDTMEMFVHTDGCLPISCPLCNKFECPVRQRPFQMQLKWTLKNILANKKHTL